MSRKENSLKNMKMSIIYDTSQLALNFASRTLFVMILSSEYLGISGLFGNILSILSLAELGIGSAIAFSLYAPISENNTEKIRTLMNVYRKAYRYIGLLVLTLGICLIPFLPILIADSHTIDNLNMIYLLYLFQTTFSYFLGYIQTLVNIDQKSYIITKYSIYTNTSLTIIRMIVLIATRNYIFYLASQIFVTLFCNVIIYFKVLKMYPYLKTKEPVVPLEAGEKRTIITNIKALIFHKIGGILVFSTDNLLISMLLGLRYVGIYANYTLIISAISKFTSAFFSGITASIGNYNASKTKDETYGLFLNLNFISYLIYLFCTICFLNLLNPFISTIWLRRDDYTFESYIVIAICVSYFVTGLRQMLLIFKDVMGIYNPDKYKALIEAVLNIIFSVVLTSKFGFLGIILGTILSSLLICYTVEPYIIFKYGFMRSPKSYYLSILLKFLFAFVTCFASVYFNQFITIQNIYLNFIAIGLNTCLIYAVSVILVFGRTSQFKFTLKLAVSTIFKKQI